MPPAGQRSLAFNCRCCLLLTAALVILCCVAGQPPANKNRGYIFVAPKKLIAGETENVCISLHNLEPPVHVSVDLLALSTAAQSNANSGNLTTSSSGIIPEDDVLASIKTTVKSGVESCMELRVTASTKYRAAKLRLRLRLDKQPDYVVEAEKKVFIEHDALVTFVETDKPIYKPDQDVNIRILTLKHDLRAWTKPIAKVWIENPSEVRVAQWTDVSTENGMAQLSFPLSGEPSSGIWKIKVEKSRPQLIHTASFEVRKYVLPRFQVTIRPPNYILADAKDATWRVCVRYSYGEAVKGTLILRLRPQTPIWKRKQPIAEINYEEKMNGSSSHADGCTNYTVSAQLLGLAHWKLAPNSVLLLANFTEAKSGVVETASSRTLVMHQPLKLEFSPHTPKYFKPGLPYHGKLRVLRPDASSPAPNEKIQICLRVRRKDEWQRSVVECRNFTSPDSQGYLDFIVPPQHKSIVLLSFVATGVDYPTKYYSPDKRWRVFVDQPSAYIDVEPWYSPSSSYLSVTRGYNPLICGDKYSFNVMYTSGGTAAAAAAAAATATGEASWSTEPVTFHYSINSKSDLLVFGHVKYKPRKDTLLDYSEFRNVIGANNQTAGSTVHRFPLSVKITASMAPRSELLLYYVRPDGEVVTSSHSIEIGQCFENAVKTAWHQDKQSPGSLARLHLEAAPHSLCGISAVDRSTSFLATPTQQQPNLLEPDSTFARLKPFHLAADSSPLQAVWAHCDRPEGDDESSDEAEEEIDHLPRPVAAAALPRPSSRKKRHSVTYNVAANYVDAIQAFDEFGTVVMSDLILESRPCPAWRSGYRRGILDPMSSEDNDEPDRMLKAVKAMPLAFQFSAPGSAGVAEASSFSQDQIDSASMDAQSSAAVIRSYFPETWIWELVSTGKEGKLEVERQLPHSITEWVANAVCISANSGLGIAAPAHIAAFQPFFLDLNLPYSAKRGEQLRLKVSLFNYMGHGLALRLRLQSHAGLELSPGQSSEVALCVAGRDSGLHEFLLVPRQLGELNVTIAAELDPERAAECGMHDLQHARDEIVKPVLVKAEGFPVEISRSAFLCPKDFSDDHSLVWEIELPSGGTPDEQLVEGSARAYVSIIGDVLGPALENLDRLIKLPMGCGEQNMILFVPNIHAINYLDAINRQTGSEMRANALRNMRKGYQRELNYRHPDGSYSAFGATDEEGSGSMWLTAFVVKSFAQARSLIQIDERDLKLSVKWIVRRQLENGCFPVVGQVFHKDMKGGLRDEDGSSSALTAYVLIALLESGVPLSASLVNNALYCLEKASGSSEQVADGGNPYGAALTTYALALLEHPRASESLRALLSRASRESEALWWEDRGRPGSLALSTEMTAYALLSLVKLGGEANMMEALRAVRWLSRKRNAEGGFSSTQDTVVGLEALTRYALAMAANASATDLSVLLTATDLEQLFRVHEERRLLLTRLALPSLPTTLEMFVEGEGCLLVQSSLRYNKVGARGSEAFELTPSVDAVASGEMADPGEDRCGALQRLTLCSRYKLPDEESNMAVLEVAMVSGYLAERGSLAELLHEPATGVKRFEENGDTVAIYFDKLTTQKTCVSFLAKREAVVDDAGPATVKLYDYYQPELTISTSYKFTEVCDGKQSNEPPRNGREPNEPIARKVEQEQKNDRQLDDRLSIDEMPRGRLDKVEEQEPGAAAVAAAEKVTMRERKIDPSVFRQRSIASFTVRPIHLDSGIEGSGVDEPDGHIFSANPVMSIFNADEVTDEGFSPAFIDVDHELDTPGGIEGPVPVYVEAPKLSTVDTHNNDLPAVSPSLDLSSFIQKVKETMNNSLSLSSCPRCGEELPSDIVDLYCRTTSAVKVAIRRSRKARLLLDLSSPRSAKRLRSTIEMDLKPECPCPPIDRPGTMALLLSLDASNDLSSSTNQTKPIFNKNISIFTVPPTVGMPPQLKKAALTCPRGP